jgi:hypothetical protein
MWQHFGTRTTDGEVGCASLMSSGDTAWSNAGKVLKMPSPRTLRLSGFSPIRRSISPPPCAIPSSAGRSEGQLAAQISICEVGGPVMNATAVAEARKASAEHLELKVKRRLGSRVRDLRVIVRRDGVILTGRASTYHAKQLAQHAAMELGALPILANDIEVI